MPAPPSLLTTFTSTATSTSFFKIFRFPPPREVIKIYLPRLKRRRREGGVGGRGFELWEPCIPSETTKSGSKFVEDNGALEMYKFIETTWFYKYQIYQYFMKHRHLSFLRRNWMYFSKKNMVYFVQIPKQSYIKVFQNMFIVFCTRIYMEMNNLRVYKLGH